MGSKARNDNQTLNTIKNLVYSPQSYEDALKLALTVSLPVQAVLDANKIDKSLYFNFDIYSHEYEAELITQDTDGLSGLGNRVEEHQKLSFSVRRLSGNHSAMFFTYYDKYEAFQARNMTHTKDIYQQLMQHSVIRGTEAGNAEFNNLARNYLENIVNNPVTLLRRKIMVALEYSNKSFTRSQLKNRSVQEDLKVYKPRLDTSQFWTTESNYSHPARVINKETFDIDIIFEILTLEAYDSNDIWKVLLVPEASMFFDNLSVDKMKSWVAYRKLYDIVLCAIVIILHAIAKIYCVREGSPMSIRI